MMMRDRPTAESISSSSSKQQCCGPIVSWTLELHSLPKPQVHFCCHDNHTCCHEHWLHLRLRCTVPSSRSGPLQGRPMSGLLTSYT